MYRRRPRSPRIDNLENSFQEPGTLGLGRNIDWGARTSDRWRNGFAEKDKALLVREQDFSVFMSRRLKISQRMSSGRLGGPLFSVAIGRCGGGCGIRVREDVITDPG